MNNDDPIDVPAMPAALGTAITLPAGLLGFEQLKRYLLLQHPDEEPFFWLNVLDRPNLSFLVVPPSEVVADYHPDISPADVEFLEVNSPRDVLMLNIVTLRENGQATVNLKGPIVLNRRTLKGKQVVPLNAAEYRTQHPLPLTN